jgi:creatinine amidohydrolase
MTDTVTTLSDLTTTELAARRGVRVAILPVGATEQHGPNLAMGVDWRIAEELARRVGERVRPLAVVLPALPYGLSAHHMAFPGTVSLTARSFVPVVTDIAESLAQQGIRKLVVVNGHRGNEAVLGVLTASLTYECDVETVSAFWMTQGADAVARHRKTERWGHACEIETSLALELTPDLVRRDVLEPGDLIDEYGAYEDNYEPFALTTARSFASRTRNGAFGDARLATQEAGAEIAEAVVSRVSAFITDFAHRPPRRTTARPAPVAGTPDQHES